MIRNFEEIETYLIKNMKKRVVLAGSHDDLALSALVRAKKVGIVDAILIGDAKKTKEILLNLGENIENYEVIDESREMRASRMAIKMIQEGKADIPMKGLMQTSSFLMAIQNPIGGIMEKDGLLNEVTIFYYDPQDRIIITGDCAINIAPNFDEKVKITKNLIQLAKAFGYETVKVAALSVVEKVNPTIQSSVDAKALSELDWGENVLVEGPLALDNALDEEAAKHKGIISNVAGKTNVILMPDIHAGNVFHKSIHFLGHMKYASGTLGAKTPIIMNSRTDDEDAKYYSILSALLLATKGE